jgi:hypothetical protein
MTRHTRPPPRPTNTMATRGNPHERPIRVSSSTIKPADQCRLLNPSVAEKTPAQRPVMRPRMRRKQHEHRNVGNAKHDPQRRTAPAPRINAQTNQPKDNRKRSKHEVGHQQPNQPANERHGRNRNRLGPRVQTPGPRSRAARPSRRRRTARLGGLGARSQLHRFGTLSGGPNRLGRSVAPGGRPDLTRAAHPLRALDDLRTTTRSRGVAAPTRATDEDALLSHDAPPDACCEPAGCGPRR